MDEARTTLAAEVAAELELVLPDAAAALAEKLRLAETLHAQLSALGLVRVLRDGAQDTTHHDVCGLAADAASLPAFGGLLYGIAIHAHRLELAQRTIHRASEHVRVHLGDLDFYVSGKRLQWKATQHFYELIEELLALAEPPPLLLLDLPIFLSRGDEGNRELIEDVQEEWLAMTQAVNAFWQRRLPTLYPLRSDGAIIASVHTQAALPLFVALSNNPHTSPDRVDPQLPAYIQAQWKPLRRAGMARLVDALLPPMSRTVAFAFEDLNLDARWQPEVLHHSGVLSFFMRAGPQTPIWQIQVAGHRTDWTSERLDQLARAICHTTLGVGRHAEPLPLWYARRLATFPRPMLEVFRDLARERMDVRSDPIEEEIL